MLPLVPPAGAGRGGRQGCGAGAGEEGAEGARRRDAGGAGPPRPGPAARVWRRSQSCVKPAVLQGPIRVAS